MQRTLTQSIPLTFLLCLKRSVSQTLKISSCKKVFPKCVYHGYNLLRWMFFVTCDNWKTFFFIQAYHYPEAWCNRHVELRSLKQVFWKKSRFYINYFYINITMLLIPQCSYFLHVLNKIYFLIVIFYSFSLWMLDLNVPHVSL